MTEVTTAPAATPGTMAVTIARTCSMGNGTRFAGFVLGHLVGLICTVAELQKLVAVGPWLISFRALDKKATEFAIETTEPANMTHQGNTVCHEPETILGRFQAADGVIPRELLDVLRNPSNAKIKFADPNAQPAAAPGDDQADQVPPLTAGSDQADESPTDDQAADLEGLSVPELKALAKERGHRGYSSLNKSKLLNLLG